MEFFKLNFNVITYCGFWKLKFLQAGKPLQLFLKIFYYFVYVFFFFIASKEKTHWKRHCHNCVSRAWSKALQSQEHPLALSACLCGCTSAQPVHWKCLLPVSGLKCPKAIGKTCHFFWINWRDIFLFVRTIQ